MSHPPVHAAKKPEVLILGIDDLRSALVAGWADFRAAPLFGLFFAGVYVAGGWLIFYALTVSGQVWWTLPAAAGFPILGPFIACGLYEVSRRLAAQRQRLLDFFTLAGDDPAIPPARIALASALF